MADAQISAKLSADASGYRSALSGALDYTGRVAEGITKKLDIRTAMTAIATAVGLNIQSIAESVARFVTGVTQDTEAQLRGLVSASDAATAATVNSIKAARSEQERYRAAVDEAKRAEEKMNSRTASFTEKEEAKTKLIQAQAVISEHRAKQEERVVKAGDEELRRRKELQSAQLEADRRNLDAAARVKALRKDIEVAQAAINTGVLSESGQLDYQKKIHETKLKLIEAEAAATDAATEAAKRRTEAEMEGQRQRQEFEEAEKIRARNEKAIKDDLDKLNERSRADTIFAMTSGKLGQRDVERASDDTLKEIIRRNQHEITMRKVTQFGLPGDIDVHWPLIALQNDIAKATQELNMRTKLRRDVEFMGVEGARRNYSGDPIAFDRLVQEYVTGRTEMEKTNTLLRELKERVSAGITVRMLVRPGSTSVWQA